MKKRKKREKIRIDWLDILPREQIGYWYESLQMSLNRQMLNKCSKYVLAIEGRSRVCRGRWN